MKVVWNIRKPNFIGWKHNYMPLAMLHTCQLSRGIALKVYTSRFGKNKPRKKIKGGMFFADHDILHFEETAEVSSIYALACKQNVENYTACFGIY